MEMKTVWADSGSYYSDSSLLAAQYYKNVLCSGVWFFCFGRLLAQE